MTATVTIRQPGADDRQTWARRLRAALIDPIFDVFGAGNPPRPDCLQSASQQPAEVSTLPYARVPAIPSAEKLAPGLTPGIDASPRLP